MTVIAWTFHFLISVVYCAVSLAVFLVILAASISTPLVVGALLFMGLRELPGGEKSSVVILPVLGGVAASILILLGTLRGIVRFLVMEAPGIRNTSDVVQRTLTSVARRLRVSPFTACFVDGGVGAYTYLTARGKYVVVGCHALRHLDVLELGAILAHEYAHHLHGAMLENRVHFWVVGWFDAFRRGLVSASSTATARAAKRGSFEWVWHFATLAMLIELLYLLMFSWYLRVVGRALRHADYEFYCDDVAIKMVGGGPLASALDKIADLHLAYQAALESKEIGDVDQPTALCEALDRHFDAIRASRDPQRDQIRTAWSPTHPPVALRIHRAGGFASHRRTASVWSQADSVGLLRELSAPV